MLKTIFSALLFCGLNVFAQITEVRIPKPPPVTLQELSEMAHLEDSSAVAAYKYRYGRTFFEKSTDHWLMVTEVYTRVKIYNKTGYEYANAEIIFYSGTRGAKGYFSDANTYNLVNGSIEKTPLTKSGEFEEKYDERHLTKKIVLPNVKEGSIIEYKYTIKTPYFSEFSDWYFQFPIPADNVRYDVFIPVYFTYNIYSTGFSHFEQTTAKLVYDSDNGIDDQYYCYVADNVKAIKEAYVNNIGNYTTILKHEIASVQFPNRPRERFSTDWATVAKTIYENDSFGRELKYNSYFEEDIDRIVKNNYTPGQKADSIFAFVRDRMSWDGKFNYTCTKGVKRAYQEKTGNVAEINLMLTAMLRYAGLDANPVLISTRANGIAVFPTRYAYNYVIASVNIDGNIILMDATGKYSVQNVLPLRVLNWNGRLIKKDGQNEDINVMPKSNSREIINLEAKIDNSGKVTGNAREVYSNYSACFFRELYATLQRDGFVQKMESIYRGTAISNFKISNDKNLYQPLTDEYDFLDTMHAEAIGDKIYFNPVLFLAEQDNPFKSEKRDYPIDFNYPVQRRYIINIELPEGYKIESSPRPLSLNFKNNTGSFKYNVAADGNIVRLAVVFEINQSIISPEYYKELKDFFQKMIDKQNEKIVLTKS